MTNNGYYRINYKTDKSQYRSLFLNIEDNSEPTKAYFAGRVKEWISDEEEVLLEISEITLQEIKQRPLIFTKNPHGGEHLIEPPETLTFKQFNELVFDNNLEYTLENGVYTTRKGDITYITKVNNNE